MSGIMWDGEIQFVNKIIESAKKLSAMVGDLEYSCDVTVEIYCSNVRVGVLTEEDGIFRYEQTEQKFESAA